MRAMYKQLKTYVVIGASVAMLLGACSTSDDDTKGQVVSSESEKPAIHVMMNDKEVKAETASYELNLKNKNQENEGSPVDELGKEIKAETVEPGSLIQVYFDKKSGFNHAFIREWKNQVATDVKTDDYRFQAPEEEGEHTYEVLSYFDNGNVQYVFKINVQKNK